MKRLKDLSSPLYLFVLANLFSVMAVAQASKSQLSSKETNLTLKIIPLNDALDREFSPLHKYKPKGPLMHILEGSPTNGSSITLFRYCQNYAGSGKLHNHTNNYRLWIIEGVMKHWNENGSEETATILTSGSYLYQPADEFHAANCLSERCTAYVIFDGPIETSFPDGKKTDPNGH